MSLTNPAADGRGRRHRHQPFSVTARGITVYRADRPVLVDVDLTLTERSRTAIVGPNGVGKSTLLRVVAGRLIPDSGTVTASPPATTVGLLDQELDVADHRTVERLLASRVGVAAAEDELAVASAALADEVDDGHDTVQRYEQALQRYLTLGAADFGARLHQVAAELGLGDHLLSADPATLSGGEAERVGLAAVMLSRFDLTLLDEPTNNLDLDGLDLLERWVGEHRGGLVIVSHDRAFLERTVSTVVEIDHHAHTVATFGGGWLGYLDERTTAAALARRRYDDYVDQRDQLATRVQQQREWSAQGLSRAKKSPADGDKHRKRYDMAKAEGQTAKAKATQRELDRLDVVDKPWEPWELRFTINRADRSGGTVASFEQAVLQRGTFRLGPIDEVITWAERVVIRGENGSGKSTLLAGLLGDLEPSSGTIRLGSAVVVGSLGQQRDHFVVPPGVDADDESLLAAFQGASGLELSETRSLLAKFGLDAEAIGRPTRSLSPGERTRARLALFQARGVNLLVLDEPTNHLDLPAIEQLEAALDTYDGTLVVVSHDRRFLDNVRTDREVVLGTPR
jgi:ATPase subunit of ABC transporter with duplicated ATPase domains